MSPLLPTLLLTLPLPAPAAAPGPDVVIGLFLASDPGVAAAMRAGATEALTALAARDVRLVHRQAGAGWDGGARRAAQLVFEDGAQVVVAPPDAREAHDAALVTTRSRTPVLHLTTDVRLRHDRVPWSFCLAPRDRPAPDTRALTRTAVTHAVLAARAARDGTGTLTHHLQQRIPDGDVLRRIAPNDPAPVSPSPSARCQEDSARSPQS